ncbi:discoidin domain-containing protein [Bacteroidota bacterium]
MTMTKTPKFILATLFVLTIHFSGRSQTVDKLMLIDASSDTELKEMAISGDSIDLDVYPLISFRAVTNPEPLPAGNCVFKITYPSGQVYSHSEGTPVYACFGDNTGDYLDWESGYNNPPPIETGTYSMMITPGTGAASTFSFSIKKTDTGGGDGGDGGVGPYDTISVDTGQVLITGEKKQWHNIILHAGGPNALETGTPNPFLDYRFRVLFTQGDFELLVPGYFAADGNASETGASEGNVWRAHFCPPQTGTWTYLISFESGTALAIADSSTSGTPFVELDGKTGTIEVEETDKSGRDLRGKGRLEYVGEHHLRFAGSGDRFLKAGADAPENLLAYDDFDNTPNAAGRRKSWGPHVQDWESGDPVWRVDKGKGLIGAINYLSGKGMNAFSFLTMNINGDDKNVYPYISSAERTRFDCSKLDQWEIVFDHATTKGMYLHFKTQETENETLLDNGALGTQRKVYYRELIARFGHHLALNWNLGEENGVLGDVNQTSQQRKDMARYFHDNDPYQNLIVLHTGGGSGEEIYRPLLGSNSELTGISLYTGWNSVYSKTAQWVEESAAAGKKWIVANDEQGSADIGVPDDSYNGSPSLDDIRKETLWGNLMAGGAGVEYYFGYKLPNSDLTCQDFRSRDKSWDYAKIALDFFNLYVPFWEMTPNNSKTSNGWCLAGDSVYVVYLKTGGEARLNLPDGRYSVRWYNPREGGALISQSIDSINGGNQVSAGVAPSYEDWALLVREVNYSHDGNDTELFPCKDALVYSSYNDFPEYTFSGFVPAYKDEGNNCLAINAVNYKDQYAAARTSFNGEYGMYRAILKTLTETDGESSYRLKINGQLLGEVQNPETSTDYLPAEFSWDNIEMFPGDVVQVEFNTHTNGKIPEGDTTAYSRGRWVSIAFQPLCSTEECTESDVFEENDGYLVIDMESVVVPNANWSFRTGSGTLGDGFLEYIGPDHMSSEVSSARMLYKIKISTPGTYQFLWRTRRGFDSQAADQENDSWLKISASKFYGTKNGATIDCSGDFIKVWMQKTDFLFECFGEHHGTNGMAIYADFNSAGEYTIEVSGRSKGHLIDRMALFMEGKKTIATASTTLESGRGCGAAPTPEPPADTIHVEELYLAYDTILIEVGEAYKLRATVLPGAATDKSLSWSAENTGIAEVSDGTITGTGIGESLVSATTNDGNYYGTCLVRVIENRIKYDLWNYWWQVIYADSEDTEKYGRVKKYAIDGEMVTFWYTQWFSAQPPFPHELHIDLGSTQNVDIIDYYSRQDVLGSDGTIGKYEFYLSDNNLEWGEPIAKGEFKWARNATKEDYRERKRIYLDSTATGRYFRLLALSEAQNIQEVTFTAVAELELKYYAEQVGIGIEDQNTIVRVYPNPVSDYLHVLSDRTYTDILITQLDGRQVFLENSKNKEVFDVSYLRSGTYLIQIKNARTILYNSIFIKE